MLIIKILFKNLKKQKKPNIRAKINININLNEINDDYSAFEKNN